MNRAKETKPSRATDARKKVWAPPSQMDAPAPPPGYRYRFVRMELLGDTDDANVVSRIRQHYEPVRADEIAGFHVDAMKTGEHAGIVRSGDCILCKVPEEVVQQRDAYYQGQAERMMDAVDGDLDKNSSDVMPIHKERRTRVTKGRPKEEEFDD